MNWEIIRVFRPFPRARNVPPGVPGDELLHFHYGNDVFGVASMSNVKDKKVVVCGGGGFIGGHLVDDLLKKGYSHVRCIDVKPFDKWYQVHPEAENIVAY